LTSEGASEIGAGRALTLWRGWHGAQLGEARGCEALPVPGQVAAQSLKASGQQPLGSGPAAGAIQSGDPHELEL